MSAENNFTLCADNTSPFGTNYSITNIYLGLNTNKLCQNNVQGGQGVPWGQGELAGGVGKSKNEQRVSYNRTGMIQERKVKTPKGRFVLVISYYNRLTAITSFNVDLWYDIKKFFFQMGQIMETFVCNHPIRFLMPGCIMQQSRTVPIVYYQSPATNDFKSCLNLTTSVDAEFDSSLAYIGTKL